MQLFLKTHRIKLTWNVFAFGLLLAYLTPTHAEPESSDGERAILLIGYTEGWLVDTCLLDMAMGTINNLTAIDRVSIYNTGLFFRPDGAGYGFTPLMNGVSLSLIHI
jgi:hypothetical protein